MDSVNPSLKVGFFLESVGDMERGSMVFYKSFYESIKKLSSKSQRCDTYEAILEYAFFGRELPTKGMVEALFTMAKPQIDANNRRYENGKKGGRKVTDNGTKIKPMVSEDETIGFCLQKPNENVNENENANENEDENENENNPPIPPRGGKAKRETQEQIYSRISAGKEISQALDEKLREWLKYKAERDEPYKETGMQNMITQVLNRVGKHGEAMVIQRISQAMAETWKGMNLDKLEELPRAMPQSKGNVFDEWKSLMSTKESA